MSLSYVSEPLLLGHRRVNKQHAQGSGVPELLYVYVCFWLIAGCVCAPPFTTSSLLTLNRTAVVAEIIADPEKYRGPDLVLKSLARCPALPPLIWHLAPHGITMQAI